MRYEIMGRLHAACSRLSGRRGQGTVEYVGLMLLIAVVLGAVVKAAGDFGADNGIAEAIVKKMKEAVGRAGEAGAG